MNDKRRKKLAETQRMLQYTLDTIERILDEERDALTGIPENMSERVERCESTISDLEGAKSSLEEAMGQLESAADR